MDEECAPDWLALVSTVARVDDDVQVVWSAAVAVMASVVLDEVDVVRPARGTGTGGSGRKSGLFQKRCTLARYVRWFSSKKRSSPT